MIEEQRDDPAASSFQHPSIKNQNATISNTRLLKDLPNSTYHHVNCLIQSSRRFHGPAGSGRRSYCNYATGGLRQHQASPKTIGRRKY
jgi:hypothetical protein